MYVIVDNIVLQNVWVNGNKNKQSSFESYVLTNFDINYFFCDRIQ